MDNPRLAADDTNLAEEDGAGDIALLTPPEEQTGGTGADDRAVPASAHSVPAGSALECANCQAPMLMGQTVCKKCGFYPTLNTFVEVDPEHNEQSPGAEQPRSHLEVWKSLIPRWAWGLIAGIVALLALSVAGRLMAPAGSARAIWTYVQFGAGVIALAAAHISCYMFAIMLDSTLSFIDVILKPFAVWAPSIHDLPKSFKRVALGAWGLSAALFAALVVGGVRYDEIIDWGKVPPKKKAKPAVAVPIDAQKDDKSMDEALDEFTKNAGVAPDNKSDSERDKEKGNRQKMVKCLVIGFTPSRESDFDSLIVAVEEGGKWRFAGVVNEGLPVEARSTLNRRMRMVLRPTPVVPCELKAFWLEPKLMCSVWYEDWTEDQRLKRPFFDKLQPDFELRKPKP